MSSRPRPASIRATPIPTTIGAEWEENLFIRIWRGIDAPGDGRCTVLDRAGHARAVRTRLRRRTQGLVRWEDGSHDVVPGSRVVKGALLMDERTPR